MGTTCDLCGLSSRQKLSTKIAQVRIGTNMARWTAPQYLLSAFVSVSYAILDTVPFPNF
jgi:hypothetical protein